MSRSRIRRWLLAVAAFLVVSTLAHQYVRAYRIHGASDAPSYLEGDLILVNRAAYDLRLPFSSLTVVPTGTPERGDVVILRRPGLSQDVSRRIVGLPGDRVEVRDSRVILNGRPLDYEPADPSLFEAVGPENRIGAVVEWERGVGAEHLITYSPGECGVATTSPVTVPEDHYFVLGDNRDHCVDSRRVGTIERGWIRGKVLGTIRSRR